jgi:DNA-binding MarR family transcriptional regulator
MTEASSATSLVERCRDLIDRLAELSRSHGGWWLSLDMSMRQVKAVFVLAIHGPVSVGGLGRRLDLAEPTASLLVEELVTQGLAAREIDPLDRRRTLVKLTNEGAALVDRLQQTRDENLIRWLGQLGEDDLQAVLRGLEAILRAAQGCSEASGPAERNP